MLDEIITEEDDDDEYMKTSMKFGELDYKG